MPELSKYPEAADRFISALSLKQPPVAISFTDELPRGMPLFSGRVPAGCRFWQEGTHSSFATTAADHALCSIGVYTHNLEATELGQTELMDALKIFGDLDYVRPEDLPEIPVLRSRSSYVLYGPLAQVQVEPDVVLLMVNVNQSLILSETVQQVDHENAPAMGRPACAVVSSVINEQRAALSLGCCGARAYLDVLTEEVALFALPPSKLECYLERLEVLANANKILSTFHYLRRQEVDAGKTPTVRESLAGFKAARFHDSV